MRGSVLAVGALLAACGSAHAQFMLVGDQSNDRIMQFSAFDGSLLNPDFIVNGDGTNYEFGTPKGIAQVGQEIWVADQITDQIARFDLSGNWLSTISGGLDNMRGLNVANGRVYVANAGSGNGAPGESLVMFGFDGTPLGSFPVDDPFDVIDYGGRLLVSNIDTDDIDSWSYTGSLLGVFHSSDGASGIDFPQQLAVTSAGTILAAGFSAPDGVYEYAADGTQLNYWEIGSGNRGVAELLNGNIMFTDGQGVYVFDRHTGVVTPVATGFSGQYIAFVVPAPGAAGLMGLAGLAALRRRR